MKTEMLPVPKKPPLRRSFERDTCHRPNVSALSILVTRSHYTLHRTALDANMSHTLMSAVGPVNRISIASAPLKPDFNLATLGFSVTNHEHFPE